MENTTTTTTFQREDWQLFRNIASLGQKAGVPRHLLPALALKELADNALDAGALCTVGSADGFYRIVDNGPGIAGTDEDIARLFSIRRSLTSSKLYRLPTRGALGNGLRVVAGVVLCSGGELRVTTRGRRLTLKPQDDGHTTVVASEPDNTTATIIEIKFGGEMTTSRDPLALARVAVAMRGVSRYEGKTNPHWYDSDSFFELLQGAGELRLGELIDNIGGSKGGLLAGGILARSNKCSTVSRDAAEALLTDMRERCKQSKPAVLGEVGEHTVSSHGYAKKADYTELTPGIGKLKAQLPVVVEVWALRANEPAVTILVNRTPVTAECSAYGGQTGHRAETTIYGCGLRHRFKTGKAPMNLTLCVTTPYMSITTDGKEPNLLPLFNLIKATIESACRKARLATSEGRQTSKKDVILGALRAAINKASGGGKHRFSLRQLFYAVRPHILNAGGEEPDYGYFCTVIAEYEKEQGQIRSMYRDARGIVYHPHTRETIPLGTLNVERYRRPEYRFNKVLYVEKGGFFELLKDAQWPERHDCALMTSQGFASGAAKDLMDLIGDGDEEVKLFCVHDADGYGTCIYEGLIKETNSRPGRRVNVINLGLDPEEAVRIGLAEEKVDSKKKVPVADYIKDGWRGWHWEEWLQTHRVELNAMTSPQFLEWLDSKMADHDEAGKLVPPVEVMQQKLEELTRAKVRERLVERALRAANIERQIEETMECISLPRSYTIESDVRSHLKTEQAAAWEKPLDEIAAAHARDAVG